MLCLSSHRILVEYIYTLAYIAEGVHEDNDVGVGAGGSREGGVNGLKYVCKIIIQREWKNTVLTRNMRYRESCVAS